MISVNEGSYQINVYVRDTVLLLDSNSVVILITSIDLTTLFLNRTISLITLSKQLSTHLTLNASKG